MGRVTLSVRPRLLIVAAAGCLGLLSCVASGAQGYALNAHHCSWPTMRRGGAFGWTNNATGDGRTDFFDSKNDWNATATKVYLSGSGSGIVTDNPYYGYDNGTDGLTTYSYKIYSDGHCDFTGSTSVNLNSYFGARYTDEERKSVTAHEFGHSIGLAHSSSSSCSSDPIMEPLTSMRYGTCGHFRPQPDDVSGVNALLGNPGAACDGCDPSSGATVVATGTEEDPSYSVSYESLEQLRKDAAAVVIVRPTGASTQIPQPNLPPDTSATVNLVRQIGGTSLPDTFQVHEVGSPGIEGSFLMSAGHVYLLYLRPGDPVVLGQYDLVGGSQAMFVTAGSSLPGDSSQAFTPVDPEVASSLPAAVSIDDAGTTG